MVAFILKPDQNIHNELLQVNDGGQIILGIYTPADGLDDWNYYIHLSIDFFVIDI